MTQTSPTKTPLAECFLSKRKMLSGNVLRRMHWARRRRDGLAIYRELFYVLGKAPSTPGGRVRLTITRYLGPRERFFDTDNAYGGSTKEIIDALCRLGWFVDDKPEYLVPVVEQNGERRDQPGIHIYMEVIDAR